LTSVKESSAGFEDLAAVMLERRPPSSAENLDGLVRPDEPEGGTPA
jgi:hypothetical protein